MRTDTATDTGVLRVELWRAPAVRTESWDRRPVVVARPGAARFVRAASPPGEEFVIGHHDDPAPTDHHLAWTTPRDDEDLQLSRTQLWFTRAEGAWWVEVPGPRSSKREATVQYWASANSVSLVAGGEPLRLDPSAYPCVIVPTDRAFYWALVTSGLVPPRPRAEPPVRPARSRTSALSSAAPPGARLPAGWKEAVQIKFAPFLTWPMGWRPAAVDPKAFLDATGTPVPARARQSVTRRVRETKEYAIAHGYGARDAYGATEVELLTWLRLAGLLSFNDRLEWLSEDTDRSTG